MFQSSTDEVSTGGDTPECASTSHTTGVDRSGFITTTPASVSSHQSAGETSTSPSHGQSLPQIATGKLHDNQFKLPWMQSLVWIKQIIFY